MSKPTYELATIIKDYKHAFIKKHQPLKFQLRTLHAIEICRTAHLGGHVDKCNTCNHKRISYNSCRNRHCPKCQVTNKERWIEARHKDLLPTTYFHVVFTIPHELNSYCINYPKDLYNILFEASKETIETFSQDEKHLGAKTGMISLLHTWGQNLSLHPHVHMIVPGGGITDTGLWKHSKSDGNFLFPVQSMSIVYKNKFMEKLGLFLKSQNKPIEVKLRRALYNKNWVVYAKDCFVGPKQVIEYLGRYSHKIAISNHRIKNVEDGKVSFSYKDYADNNKQKIMTLEADEFLRRFCLHILPPKFMKIRHYGILSSRYKPLLRKHQFSIGIIVQSSTKRDWKEITKSTLGFDVDKCPCCKTGTMIRIQSFDANAPPIKLIEQLKKQVDKKNSIA
jgi:predicted nuclease of predicted toxin-antitoxin system